MCKVCSAYLVWLYLTLPCATFNLRSDTSYVLTSTFFPTEFPRLPTGVIRRHIADEADARLAFYLAEPAHAQPDPQPPQQEVQDGQRRRLPDGVVDTPLVRVFNFLRE